MRFPTGHEVAKLRGDERNFSRIYLGIQKGAERGDWSAGTLMMGQHYQIVAADGYVAAEHLLYFNVASLVGTDVRPNMTLLCGTAADPSAYGSVRIRAIGLGTGPGGEDGLYLEPNELVANGYLVAGDYIWIDGVYRLYRKLPFVRAGVVFEDGNANSGGGAGPGGGGIPGYGLPFIDGVSGNPDYMDRPIALMGSPRFAWTGENVDFYGWRSHGRGGNTIQNWTWDFDGGVVAGPGIGFPGSPASPIHVRWNSAGEYIASLVVEDNSGRAQIDDYGVPYDRHRAVRPVLVYDRPGEGDDTPYMNFEVESLTGKYGSGWSCRITVFGTADKTEFPDNALIIVYAEDWYGDEKGSIGGWYGQEGILFCGYIRADSVVADFEKSTVSFEARTIEQWMKDISIWPSNCVSTAGAPAAWHQFNLMTVEDVLWYLAEFRSNLKDVTDCFFASDVGAEKRLGFVDLTEASLYDQMSEQLGSCFFGQLSASRHGSVHLFKHKNMMDLAERIWWGPPVYSFSRQDWSDEIQIGEERQRDSVAQVDFIGFVYDASGNPLEVYSLAPARQTNFGRIEKVSGILLSGATIVGGQAENNTLSGLSLAWKNIRFPHITIPTRHNNRVLEPAEQDYFAVVLAANDTERGLIWAGKEFLTTDVSVRVDNENGIIDVDVGGEASTWGPDGVAGPYPAGPPAGDPPNDNPPGYWPSWPPGATPGNPDGDPPPWAPTEDDASVLADLVAFWRLMEEDGAVRDDCVANNNLINNNVVTRIEGKVGLASHFTRAAQQYLDIPDNPALSSEGTSFTFCGWVYLDSKPNGGGSVYMSILAKYGGGGTEQEYWLYWESDEDRFRWHLFTEPVGVQVRAHNFGAVPMDTWCFVICWLDLENAEVGITVNNGVPDTAASGANVILASTDPFEIGHGTAIADHFWDGRIDAVGFWKRVLTEAERTYLWNDGDGREICIH